jgi:hypothetical protein
VIDEQAIDFVLLALLAATAISIARIRNLRIRWLRRANLRWRRVGDNFAEPRAPNLVC